MARLRNSASSGGGGGSSSRQADAVPALDELCYDWKQLHATYLKFSYQIYNYGEGLVGVSVASEAAEWVYSHAKYHADTLNSMQSQHPPGWAEHFASGIKTSQSCYCCLLCFRCWRFPLALFPFTSLVFLSLLSLISHALVSLTPSLYLSLLRLLHVCCAPHLQTIAIIPVPGGAVQLGSVLL
ncbi:unnamed protein product, partial [Closterium sp. NIES-54]